MKRSSLLIVAVLSVVLYAHNSMAQTSVKINEAFSRGVAGNLDWVEMYNPGAASVDISNYKIYDGGGKLGTKAKKVFPAGTVLAAKGFTVCIVDTASFTGDLSGFGLSSTADTVWVENTSGVVIDSVCLPALGVDTSYARIPDGSGNFVKTTPVTRGASNVLVKMNEIYSRGVAGALDWIEIYNSSSAPINVGGYKIYDVGGQSGAKGKKVIPAGTVLAANGFTVIVTDTASFVNDTTGFGLSSGGETVWLENASGLVIDTVAIPALGVDTSYARKPDGSNVFVKASPTTKGKANGAATSVKRIGMVAGSYTLDQNYPNPFNPSTTISFSLPGTQRVTVQVFDILGKQVAELVNGVMEAGTHVVQFDAHALTSGMYFYKLQAGGYCDIKKMVVVK